MVLIGIALPNFPANALVRFLSERRHCCSKSSGVFLESNLLGAGFLGEGVLRVSSVSDNEIDESHSKSTSEFASLLFLSLLTGFCLPVGCGLVELS